jgi:hypothetical protein
VDPTGNVWIKRAGNPLEGLAGPVPESQMDVIGENGVLVDRVRLPAGRIVGVGRGVVYMAVDDAQGTHLMKVAVR